MTRPTTNGMRKLLTARRRRKALPVERYPCPCCGHQTLLQPHDSYDPCPVYFWEDDPYQLRYPELLGRANGLRLIDSQQNFQAMGACAPDFVKRSVLPGTMSLSIPAGGCSTRLETTTSATIPTPAHKAGPAGPPCIGGGTRTGVGKPNKPA